MCLQALRLAGADARSGLLGTAFGGAAPARGPWEAAARVRTVSVGALPSRCAFQTVGSHWNGDRRYARVRGVVVNQPPDPFASPVVGPTPFAAPATSAPVCPKCGWHQPDGARSCAACGLIFARYAEVERRRQARAAEASRSHDGGGVAGARAEAGWPASPAGVATMAPADPIEIRVGDIVGSAASGASGALWPLVALQLTPFGVAIGLGAGASMLAPTLMGLQRYGVVPVLLLAAVVLLVVVRVGGAIVAGALVAVDDAMGGHEGRGALGTIGEGWARGGRAVGVWVVVGLASLVPSLPLAAAARAEAGAPVLLGLALVAIGGACVLTLRLSLALPLAVLGQRDVTDALGESWAVSGRHLWPMALSFLLAALVAMPAYVVLMLLQMVPVVGLLVAIVGWAWLTGFGMAVVAALFRRLCPSPTPFG
jgi:hypothetical protein